MVRRAAEQKELRLAQVLVTGGAGFIGSHLVDALVAEGEKVRVLDDLSTGREENLAGALSSGRVELRIGTVVDHKVAESAAEGCERVFHLAATVGVRRVLADPAAGLRNNILGADSILGAVRRTRPRSLVLFSSSEVYGRTSGGPLAEDAASLIGPTDVPRWSYAAGKAVGEFLALGEHRRQGTPVTIVRCFNTCGPRQIDAYGMVIPSLLRQALTGETMTVYGDGRQTRCFSYVGDVVRGVLALSNCESSRGEVYNIGTDQEITILDLAQSIRRICRSSSPIALVPYEEAYGRGFEDVPRRVPDLRKLRAGIDYSPRVDLERLLEITRDWVLERRTVDAPVVSQA
jgi:UDP-glucose 4-epimerase